MKKNIHPQLPELNCWQVYAGNVGKRGACTGISLNILYEQGAK